MMACTVCVGSNISKELLVVLIVFPSYLLVLGKNKTCNQTTGLYQLVNHKLVMSLPSSGHTVGTRMRRDRGLALLLLLSAVVESNSTLKGIIFGLQMDMAFKVFAALRNYLKKFHSNMSYQKHYTLDNLESRI